LITQIDITINFDGEDLPTAPYSLCDTLESVVERVTAFGKGKGYYVFHNDRAGLEQLLQEWSGTLEVDLHYIDFCKGGQNEVV